MICIFYRSGLETRDHSSLNALLEREVESAEEVFILFFFFFRHIGSKDEELNRIII